MRIDRWILGAIVLLTSLASGPAWAGWVDAGSGGEVGQPASIELLEGGVDGVVVSFSLAGFEADPVALDGGAFTALDVPGCGWTAVEGAPRLPVCRRAVEIPQGAGVVVEVMDARWVELPLDAVGDGARPVPVQAPVPKHPGAREAAVFAFDPAAYLDAVAAAPDGVASVDEPAQLRGHTLAMLQIAPLEIDAAAGVARALAEATVTLRFEGGSLADTHVARARYASPDVDGFAARAALNTDAFAVRDDLPTRVGYLIVAADPFVDAVRPFAELRRELGYDVTLVPMSTAAPGNGATELRGFVLDAYAGYEVPPTFLLLVGDTGQIPPFWGDYSGSVSDLYYTTMNGPSDWLPDLYVGRFSCDTASQVERLVAKTLDYARFDFDGDRGWVQRATFMASEDNFWISEGTHDYCIDHWMEPAGFDSTRRYTVSTHAYSGQVIGDLELGVSQLTYSGHGYTTGWSDGPPIDASDVQFLQNTRMWPVVQSYACNTGDFGLDSFGETWINAPEGAVAFWGSSTTSYWDEDDILQRAVYDAWFGHGVTWLRGALDAGMWALYEAYGGGGSMHRYYEQYNLLGDPALDPWTADPADLALELDAELPPGSETIAVRVLYADSSEPVVGARVCVTGADEALHAVALTDDHGLADLALDPTPVTDGELLVVWASGHDLRPVSATVPIVEPPVGDDDDDATGDDDDSIGPHGLEEGDITLHGGCECDGSRSRGFSGSLVALLLVGIVWGRRRGR